MEPILRISELTKHYRKFRLGPLNLVCEPGVVTAIVGPNGSGKSTLFRMIMGLIKSEHGDIDIFGQSINEEERYIKQQLGYVGDQYEGFKHLKISELAELISYWYPSWNEERYQHYLERYKIDESMRFDKCSKGTQKKVEFVFAMVHQPQLLILDEPSAGLDIPSQRLMREDLIEMMEDGQSSVLIATHSVDELKSLCDYIYVLNNGQLIHAFEKDEVHDQWARIWVSAITPLMKKHPDILAYEEQPALLLTKNLEDTLKLLQVENISVTHTQRLSLEEVIEMLLEKSVKGVS